MQNEALHKEFLEAIENANLVPKESVPSDLQLVLYGYYKHGLSEISQTGFIGVGPNDLKNAFKLNALMQVKSITPDEAKERYIEIINQLLKDMHK
jgi:acyl-CoA-binding protein